MSVDWPDVFMNWVMRWSSKMNRFDSITKRVGNPLTWLVPLLMVALMTGCGGGGSGVTTTTGTSTGTVTAFGSVYVNGVKYDTTGTPIRVNGDSGSQTDLNIGDVVTVTGTSTGTTGIATSIEYWADVEGPISAVSSAANTLTVLGQAIIVNSTTVFDGVTTGLAGATPLAINNMVEVSGFRDSNGAIVASRIEKKSASFVAGNTVEVKGTVSNFTTTTFTIGTLTINYITAPTGLANGVMVEVKGTSQLAIGPLTATAIEIEDSLQQSVTASGGNRAEVEGYVTNYVSSSNFQIGGQTVNAVNATFENGSAANLTNGAKIEVDGTLSDGVLMATKIEFEQSSTIEAITEVEGPVEAITATSITLFGKTFTYNPHTQMEDEINHLALNSENILTRIVAGTQVSVDGYKNSSGNLVATRIELNANTEVVVQGALEVLAAPNLTISGLAVTTSSATQFKAADNTFINATTFFGTAIGTIIKVTGTKTGSGSTAVIAATNIKIESSGTVSGPVLTGAGINLGTAANYVILAKTGVSYTPIATTTTIPTITGNIGVSPDPASSITGFALDLPAASPFSTSTHVSGQVFAPGYAAPTPADLTTAVLNMEAAYTAAAGRTATSAATTNVGGGTLTSLTFNAVPGGVTVYEWGTAVNIPTNLTFNGNATDVFILKVAGTLDMAAAKNVVLTGGVLPKNIFWQVSGAVTIGANTHFEGIILGQTGITFGNLASINGRLLAQSAVVLDTTTVTQPAP